jgi:ADP-ribose diphosphatase
MSQKPIILHRSIIARSRLFAIEAMQIQFSNGQLRDYERLKRSGSDGAVLIVPMLDNETVLLIKEYCAGVDRYEIGLPKGKVDAGETPLQAANRELKEEVGFGANKLHHLISLTLAPAYLEHAIDVVIAQDLYPEKLTGDEPEELEVIPWKLNQINELLATGECSEARTIAALYMSYEYLRSQTTLAIKHDKS